MRTIDALILHLENAGIGTAGVNLFAGTDVNFPSTSEPILSILETGGRPPIGIHNSKSIRQPSFQITGRGDIYPDVAALVEQAYVAMGGEEGVKNRLIGDVFFLSIRPAQDPFTLPNDGNNRVRLAFNVNTVRR